MKNNIQKAAAAVELRMKTVDSYLFIACNATERVSAGGGNVFAALLLTCLQKEELRRVVIDVADLLKNDKKVAACREVLKENLIKETEQIL